MSNKKVTAKQRIIELADTDETITVSGIAARVGVSPEYVRVILSKTGKSATERGMLKRARGFNPRTDCKAYAARSGRAYDNERRRRAEEARIDPLTTNLTRGALGKQQRRASQLSKEERKRRYIRALHQERKYALKYGLNRPIYTRHQSIHEGRMRREEQRRQDYRATDQSRGSGTGTA